MTTVAVFGLGYVGAVSVAALAEAGHSVVGVDTNATKVEMINDGNSPVIEEGLSELMAAGVAAGRIRATTDAREAVISAAVSIVCVGTPSRPNGGLSLDQVERVVAEIGAAVPEHQGRHTVVIRSTMLPTSMAEVVVPTLEKASGMVAGAGFGVCFNPEFLREGSSIKDFWNPPFTLIGSDDDSTATVVSGLYSSVKAETVVVPIAVAEMVKYASNSYHALKVAFANELGSICTELGIDSHQVMDVFKKDTKLNVSAAYLTPGFAFGGSCLPKDLRALTHLARSLDVSIPLLDSILESNRRQVDRAFDLIRGAGDKRVAVLGMSFKAGTDDLRESPIVELIERLIGKGYEVAVYDRNVSLAHLHGANREYIQREIPHIASILSTDLEAVVSSAAVVVIGNADPEFAAVKGLARSGQTVVDLVRMGNEYPDGVAYHGIAW